MPGTLSPATPHPASAPSRFDQSAGKGRRRRRIGAVALAVLAALVIVTTAVPPLRARAKAVAVLARAVGVPFPRPFAHRVHVRHLHFAPGVDGDLYSPGRAAPIILSPGGNPEGKDDPRLVRVARSIAGAGRMVLVPQLELRHQIFEWFDVQRLVASVEEMRRMSGGHPVGLVGFSYGGSFCLLAAEDPRIAPAVDFVAVFGSFDDLLGVVQGITTGASTYGGKLIRWKTVPEARDILIRSALGLVSPQDRLPLSAALAAHDPSGLSPPTHRVFDLLENTDPRRTYRLASSLPEGFRSQVARFSPVTNLARLRAPLFIMQSVNDPATPPTEAYRLHRSVPGSRLVILHQFLHVYPPGKGTPVLGDIADGWGAWKFVSWILAAQE